MDVTAYKYPTEINQMMVTDANGQWILQKNPFPPFTEGASFKAKSDGTLETASVPLETPEALSIYSTAIKSGLEPTVLGGTQQGTYNVTFTSGKVEFYDPVTRKLKEVNYATPSIIISDLVTSPVTYIEAKQDGTLALFKGEPTEYERITRAFIVRMIHVDNKTLSDRPSFSAPFHDDVPFMLRQRYGWDLHHIIGLAVAPVQAKMGIRSGTGYVCGYGVNNTFTGINDYHKYYVAPNNPVTFSLLGKVAAASHNKTELAAGDLKSENTTTGVLTAVGANKWLCFLLLYAVVPIKGYSRFIVLYSQEQYDSADDYLPATFFHRFTYPTNFRKLTTPVALLFLKQGATSFDSDTNSKIIHIRAGGGHYSGSYANPTINFPAMTANDAGSMLKINQDLSVGITNNPTKNMKDAAAGVIKWDGAKNSLVPKSLEGGQDKSDIKILKFWTDRTGKVVSNIDKLNLKGNSVTADLFYVNSTSHVTVSLLSVVVFIAIIIIDGKAKTVTGSIEKGIFKSKNWSNRCSAVGIYKSGEIVLRSGELDYYRDATVKIYKEKTYSYYYNGNNLYYKTTGISADTITFYTLNRPAEIYGFGQAYIQSGVWNFYLPNFTNYIPTASVDFNLVGNLEFEHTGMLSGIGNFNSSRVYGLYANLAIFGAVNGSAANGSISSFPERIPTLYLFHRRIFNTNETTLIDMSTVNQNSSLLLRTLKSIRLAAQYACNTNRPDAEYYNDSVYYHLTAPNNTSAGNYPGGSNAWGSGNIPETFINMNAQFIFRESDLVDW